MRKFNQVITLLLIATLLASVLVGCSGNQEANDKDVRTVVDIAGRTVELPAQVDSIVTVFPPTTAMVFAIDGGKHLVGVDAANVENKVLKDIDPEFKNVTNIGHQFQGINKEELLELKPDVVFASVMNREKTMKDIEELCPVVYVDVNTIEDLNKSMLIMGKALNKEARAQELVSYYESRMDNIKNIASQVPENEKRHVYMTSHSILKTCTAASIEDFILTVGGGINAASEINLGSGTVGELYPEITAEQLLEWNPDVIFINTYCSSDTKDKIFSDPRFADITAVKNKQVFQMPGYVFCWYIGVPESILGMEWTLYKLHPDKINFEMEKEVKNFYLKFYQLDMPDSKIKELIGEVQ